MDRHPTRRAGDGRRRPGFALLAIAVVGLLAGCSGLGVPGANGAPGGPGFTGDPCSLITTAELEAAIGGGNRSQSPEPNRESSSDSGCSWSFDSPGNPVGDNAELTVMSPGGAADFASTRQFLLALQGSPAPGGTAVASTDSSPDPASDLGISLQTVPGLGDDAFVGAAGTVYTIKGDTELELQLIAFDDPDALQHTIDLLRKALARLP
jgi:hypothetical protein